MRCHMAKVRKSVFEQPYIDIVDRLIARRRELGMTQTDLAEIFGEDQAFVSSLERRQRRIDVWEFVRLCRALKLAPSTILDKIADGAL